MVLVYDLLLVVSEVGGQLPLLIVALGEGAGAHDVYRACGILARLEGQLVGTGLPEGGGVIVRFLLKVFLKLRVVLSAGQ